MKHPALCGLFTWALFASSATFATDLGNYNTAEYCAILKSSKLSGINGLAFDCLKREGAAKAKLMPLWSGHDASLKQHCARMGDLAGGSYAVMDECIFDGLQIVLLKQLLDMAAGPKLKR